MYYQKIIHGEHLIEFSNSWTGEETVYLNSQLVSKKYSIMGTSHYFETMEAGEVVRFILISKIGGMLGVQLDLIKNGQIVQQGISVTLGALPPKPEVEFKQKGLAKLQQYDLAEALQEFREAEKINPKDPEIYFHLACVFSLKENAADGFTCLQKAVEYNLQNRESILTHEMLAFLRIQPEFEVFKENGFTLDQKKDMANQ